MMNILLYSTVASKLEPLKKLCLIEKTDDVTVLTSHDKLITVLPILPDLNLVVIILNNEQDIINAKKVESILDSNQMETKIFFVGKYETSRTFSRVFEASTKWDDLNLEIKKLDPANNVSIDKPIIAKYKQVPFKFVKRFSHVTFPVDFYLRIKSNSNEFQFVKRLKANEKFTEEELTKFINYGLKSVYILSTDYKNFIEFSLNFVLNQNTKSNDSVSDEVNRNINFQITREALLVVGINDKTIEAANNSIKEIENLISKENALVNFIKLMRSNQLSYSYTHTYLTSILLLQVVELFEWDSKEMQHKVSFLAYFHDISLTNDKLMKIHSQNEFSNLPAGFFTIDEIELINSHAFESSLIIDKFPGAPVGISQTIKEHHGSKNGMGFNNQMNYMVQPLAMIFIVVEEFVHEFLKLTEIKKNVVHNIADNLITKYNRGNYKKAAQHLKEILPQ